MKTGVAAAMFLAVASAAIAHSGVKDPTVKLRMEQMKETANHLKVVGNMAKGKTPFDATAANTALAMLADEAARIPEVFAEPADDPLSEASPAIWDEFDEFEEISVQLEKVAADAAGTIESVDDARDVTRKIAGTCKSCHADYRE